MKPIIYYIFLSIVFSSCAILYRPVLNPIVESISSDNVGLDSCEESLISIIFTKRFAELKFPDNIDQLEHIDWKNLIDTIRESGFELGELQDSLRISGEEFISDWNNCKLNFDTIIMHPYSLDSIKFYWKRTAMLEMLEDSFKIISHNSWIMSVKPDLLFEPMISDFDTTRIDFYIEIADSNGRIISKKKNK